MERSDMGSLFGVPAHMYRAALVGDRGLDLGDRQGTNRMQAFMHEVKLRFFRGFLGQRISERLYS